LVGETFRITSDIAAPDDRRIKLFSDIVRTVIFDVRKKYSKITPGNTFRYWAVPEKLTINLFVGRGNQEWDDYGWVEIAYKINPNWSLLCKAFTALGGAISVTIKSVQYLVAATFGFGFAGSIC
jgi:hypothetical protein